MQKMTKMRELRELRAVLVTARVELDAAAEEIETAKDYSGFIGNPGLRSTGCGTPEAELRFAEARVTYIRAARALYGRIYGPAIWDYACLQA